MAQIYNDSETSQKSGGPYPITILEAYEFSTKRVEIQVDEDGIASGKIFLEARTRAMHLSLGHDEVKMILDAANGITLPSYEDLKKQWGEKP